MIKITLSEKNTCLYLIYLQKTNGSIVHKKTCLYLDVADVILRTSYDAMFFLAPRKAADFRRGNYLSQTNQEHALNHMC